MLNSVDKGFKIAILNSFQELKTKKKQKKRKGTVQELKESRRTSSLRIGRSDFWGQSARTRLAHPGLRDFWLSEDSGPCCLHEPRRAIPPSSGPGPDTVWPSSVPMTWLRVPGAFLLLLGYKGALSLVSRCRDGQPLGPLRILQGSVL